MYSGFCEDFKLEIMAKYLSSTFTTAKNEIRNSVKLILHSRIEVIAYQFNRFTTPKPTRYL
ncbi:hypothetical protein ACFQ3S_05060 [Mucilaginibacter terrae]